MKRIIFFINLFLTICLSYGQNEIYPSFQVDFGMPGTSSYLNPAIKLGGYWESEESGMYFFKDALVSFENINRDSEYFTWFHSGFFISATFLSAKKHQDYLQIKAFSESFRQELVFDLKIIDENHIQVSQEDEEPKLFIRKKLDPFTIISSLGILQEFSQGSKKSKEKIKSDFKKVENFSDYLEGSYKNEDTQYWIYNDYIYEGTYIYEIQEIYAYTNQYIVVTNRKRGNQPRVFHLENDKKESTLYLKKFSLHSFESNSTEGSMFSKWQDTLAFEVLPEIFFETYYPNKEFLLTYFSNSYFEIQKDKRIYIDGEYWDIGRIWSQEYHPGYQNLEKIENYTLFIDIAKPGAEGRSIINAIVTESQILFYMGGRDFTFHHYSSFRSLVLHIFSQIGGFIISLLVLGFLVYRIFILPRKLKQRLTQSQLEGIKSQLNPHFLFNSMASIQSLMNQNKILEANRYQAELSDLLRYHLDAGAEDMVLLSEELSALQNYLELENLRSSFDFSFEVDKEINPDIVEIPNQLLQPLVENAVKHGLRYAYDPRLLIRVQKIENNLFLHIIDNGPGILAINQGSTKSLRKTHKGLPLIEEKISILNKKGLKLKLQIVDLQKDAGFDQSGTQVSLEFPLRY